MISLIGKPIIASLIMGVITILSYTLLSGLGLGNFISVLITVIVSVTVYFVMFYFQDDYMVKSIFRVTLKGKMKSKIL